MCRKGRRKTYTPFCYGTNFINTWGTELLTDRGPDRPFRTAEPVLLFIQKSRPRLPDPMLTVSPP